ncbi:MAG: YncE family protein [Ginsengibacter sp.]
MNHSKIILLSLIVFCFSGCNAQTTSQNNSLNLIASIPLPNVGGRIDHLTFDSKNKIVFVAALGNNSVEVVDLKSNKVIHTIKNLSEPQGLAFIPESNSLVIANGSNGACDVFNASTFQKTTSINLGDDADNVRYNAAEKKIYVGYASGGIAIIDATTFKLISQIKLSGHPESFQLDKSAKKIYVNVPDAHQIEVIDLSKNVVSEKWMMKQAKLNFPMALDETNHRLFIGCRHPAKLLVIDTQTGKTISFLNIDSDTDDVFYSSTNKEVYVSCGEGYVDVFTQADANSYKANGKIETKSGARTSLFITELNLLIVASPLAFSRQAALLIYNSKIE